jgi:hypothetical protein
MTLPPILLAGLLAGVAGGIVAYQQRATSCPRHRLWVGRAAYGLAATCLLLALGVLVVLGL